MFKKVFLKFLVFLLLIGGFCFNDSIADREVNIVKASSLIEANINYSYWKISPEMSINCCLNQHSSDKGILVITDKTRGSKKVDLTIASISAGVSTIQHGLKLNIRNTHLSNDFHPWLNRSKIIVKRE